MENQQPVYNALHTIPEEVADRAESEADYDDHDDDETHSDGHHEHHHHDVKQELHESFNFSDIESPMWRKVL